MKLKQWLKENPALKIVSFLIAFIIWMMVVDASNPEIKTTAQVRIDVRNEDKMLAAGKVYTADLDMVKVTCRIRTADAAELVPEDFSAYIDLEDYSVTGAVPIYLELSEKAQKLVSSTSLSPMVVHIDIEDIQEKTFDLSVLTWGEANEGYVLGGYTLSEDSVTVRGPVSEVGQISGAGIEVDIAGADRDLTGEAEIILYDANNNPVSDDLRLAYKKSVSYEIPVYPTKTLSVTGRVSGEAARDYTYEDISFEPSFISVCGRAENLADVTSVAIPSEALDISGASETIAKSINIVQYLPEGIILNQNNPEIAVIIKIRKTMRMEIIRERQTESPDLSASQIVPVEGPGSGTEMTISPEEAGEVPGEHLPAESGHQGETLAQEINQHQDQNQSQDQHQGQDQNQGQSQDQDRNSVVSTAQESHGETSPPETEQENHSGQSTEIDSSTVISEAKNAAASVPSQE